MTASKVIELTPSDIAALRHYKRLQLNGVELVLVDGDTGREICPLTGKPCTERCAWYTNRTLGYSQCMLIRNIAMLTDSIEDLRRDGQ